MATYSFTKAAVQPVKLSREIVAAALPADTGITFNEDPAATPNLFIEFAGALTAGQQTTLGGVVTAHVATPISPPGNKSPALYVNGARLRWISANEVRAGVVGNKSIVRSANDEIDIEWTGELIGTMPADLAAGAEAASTWYGVHVIADVKGVNNPKLLFALPGAPPPLPVGYTHGRRIGWVRNSAASNFLKFIQRFQGATRRYWWDEEEATLRLLTGGSATIFTAVDLSPLVPPGSENTILLLAFTAGTLGLLADNLQLRVTGSAVVNAPIQVQSPILTAAFTRFPGVEAPVNLAQSLDYKVSQSGVNKNAAHITVEGFDDEL